MLTECLHSGTLCIPKMSDTFIVEHLADFKICLFTSAGTVRSLFTVLLVPECCVIKLASTIW